MCRQQGFKALTPSWLALGRLFNSIQEGESPNDSAESELLTKEDFEAPAKSGV